MYYVVGNYVYITNVGVDGNVASCSPTRFVQVHISIILRLKSAVHFLSWPAMVFAV